MQKVIERQVIIEEDNELQESVRQAVDKAIEEWGHERIIVHLTTFSRMLAIGKKDFPGMWALYGFYFHKARKDGTNQPWALDTYCMKGLGWSKDKFYRYKKLLLEHVFIEQIIQRDNGRYRKGEKGKAGAFFIKVNHMNTTTSVQSPENPYIGKNRIEGKSDVNALIIEQEILKKNNNNPMEDPTPEKRGCCLSKGIKKQIQSEGIDITKEIKEIPENKLKEALFRFEQNKCNIKKKSATTEYFKNILIKMGNEWAKTEPEKDDENEQMDREREGLTQKAEKVFNSIDTTGWGITDRDRLSTIHNQLAQYTNTGELQDRTEEMLRIAGKYKVRELKEKVCEVV